MKFNINSLKTLNENLNGFETRKMYFVSSTAGVEASSLVYNAAVDFAKEENDVSLFSFDVGTEQLLNELISIKSGITVKDIKHKEPHYANQICQTIEYLSTLKLHVHDTDIFSETDFFEKLNEEIIHSKVIVIDRIDYASFFMNLSHDEIIQFFTKLNNNIEENDICIIFSLPERESLYKDYNVTNVSLEYINNDNLLVYINKQPITQIHFDSSCLKLYEGK